MNVFFRTFALCAVSASAWAASEGDAGALEMLHRMHAAARSLNYQGTFVYLHNGKMETMRIYHRVDGQNEQERVVHLNGSAREVIRKNNLVTCILPDHKSVLVNKLEAAHHILSALPNASIGDFKQHYRFALAGQDRVAGRDAKVVVVTPNDQYRYGYKFWLDASNSLLLKSQMMGEDGASIEQVMFTMLEETPNLPAALLEPATRQEQFVLREDTSAKNEVRNDGQEWKVSSMPQGFKSTRRSVHQLASGAAWVRHIVLSDGLASMSVYIEKLEAGKKRFIGSSYVGAMNVYGAVIDEHQVTVVGEVPRATVKMVADSIQYSKP